MKWVGMVNVFLLCVIAIVLKSGIHRGILLFSVGEAWSIEGSELVAPSKGAFCFFFLDFIVGRSGV